MAKGGLDLNRVERQKKGNSPDRIQIKPSRSSQLSMKTVFDNLFIFRPRIK